MNEKLEVVISADISALSKELQAANKLLQQHERNYKGVQNAISTNTQRTRELEGQLKRLNSGFQSGSVSQAKFTKESDRLTSELRDVNQSTAGYQKELRRLDAEIKRVTASSNKYNSTAGQTTTATHKLEKGVGGLGKTTRVNAVPAMTSFSQVIQDSPYGIQGVANNIQQLTMQMGYLSKSAGGTKAAMQALIGSLAGPAGILLAVSAVTSILTAMANKGISVGDIFNKLTGSFDSAAFAQKKFAEEATKSVAGAQGEIAVIRSLMKVVQDETVSREKRNDAIGILQDKYPGYLDNLTTENSTTKEITTSVNKLTAALENRAKVQAATQLITEKAEELFKKRIELQKEEADAVQKSLAAQQQGYNAYANGVGGAAFDLGAARIATEERVGKEFKKRLSSSEKEYQSFIDSLNQIINDTPDLNDLFSGGKGGGPEFDDDGKRKPVQSVVALPKGISASIDATREFNQELKNQIALMKIIQSDLTVGSAAYNQFGETIATLEDRLSGGFISMQEGTLAVTDAFSAMNEGITKEVAEMSMQQAAMMQILAAGFSSAITSIGNDLAAGELTIESFAKTLRGMVIKIVAASLSQALAQAIAGASSSSAATGPAAAFTLPAFLASSVGAIMGAFGSIPGFATGGMVGGNSYQGDKILARLNSGEGVLTAQGVQNAGRMLSQPNTASGGSNQLEVSGVIQANGQVLQVILDRATARNNRIS